MARSFDAPRARNCSSRFPTHRNLGQRFWPIDICMLFDPVRKYNQITGKRILGHMSFDIVHGVDIACLPIRKYAGTESLLSPPRSEAIARSPSEGRPRAYPSP